jgi:hypothetical protein
MFSFRKPGACHDARFMSKEIYLLIIDFHLDRIEQDTEQRQQNHSIAIFIGINYARNFLRSRIVSFSPEDDYNFFFAK